MDCYFSVPLKVFYNPFFSEVKLIYTGLCHKIILHSKIDITYHTLKTVSKYFKLDKQLCKSISRQIEDTNLFLVCNITEHSIPLDILPLEETGRSTLIKLEYKKEFLKVMDIRKWFIYNCLNADDFKIDHLSKEIKKRKCTTSHCDLDIFKFMYDKTYISPSIQNMLLEYKQILNKHNITKKTQRKYYEVYYILIKSYRLINWYLAGIQYFYNFIKMFPQAILYSDTYLLDITTNKYMYINDNKLYIHTLGTLHDVYVEKNNITSIGNYILFHKTPTRMDIYFE